VNYDELEKAHKEASAAHRKHELWQKRMQDHEEGNVECNHPGPVTKSGKRDKRHRCGACIEDYYEAQKKSNYLYFDYGQPWELFERIDMPLTDG